MQYVVDAVNIGGLYALMALGIGLIFGIMRLINFAHGEFVMIGAYAMWLLIELPGALTVVFSITVVVIVALATERTAFRPLRGSAPATLLVASFTVSYFLQHLVVLLVGARPKPFSFAAELAQSFEFLGLRLPVIQLISMALTLGALIGLVLLLTRTTIGIKLRAASQDIKAARLSGINVNRMLAAAFVASGALAWVVSFVYAVQIGQLSPDMGIRPVVVGFVATILGGLGSLVGAAVGGFVIGAFSVLFDAVLPVDLRVFREAFLFGFVLLVLLLRPQGLIAVAAERERV